MAVQKVLSYLQSFAPGNSMSAILDIDWLDNDQGDARITCFGNTEYQSGVPLSIGAVTRSNWPDEIVKLVAGHAGPVLKEFESYVEDQDDLGICWSAEIDYESYGLTEDQEDLILLCWSTFGESNVSYGKDFLRVRPRTVKRLRSEFGSLSASGALAHVNKNVERRIRRRLREYERESDEHRRIEEARKRKELSAIVRKHGDRIPKRVLDAMFEPVDYRYRSWGSSGSLSVYPCPPVGKELEAILVSWVFRGAHQPIHRWLICGRVPEVMGYLKKSKNRKVHKVLRHLKSVAESFRDLPPPRNWWGNLARNPDRWLLEILDYLADEEGS